jgi:hypothetical protein
MCDTLLFSPKTPFGVQNSNQYPASLALTSNALVRPGLMSSKAPESPYADDSLVSTAGRNRHNYTALMPWTPRIRRCDLSLRHATSHPVRSLSNAIAWYEADQLADPPQVSLERLYLLLLLPSCNLFYYTDPYSRPDFHHSDFSQVILHTNGGATPETLSGYFIAQEVFLVIAHVLTYFFYLIYLGRPPHGELDMVPRNKRRKARKNSPAAWGASGFLGSFAYILLVGTIFTVAILQVMWRLFFNPANGVYRAGGVMEVLLSVAFLVKLWLNVRSSPLTPGWKTFRNYAPVTISILINLVIAILNLTMCKSLVIS